MNLTNDEKNTLLYLETCMVDANHFAEQRRMNDDDFKAIEKLKIRGLIDFGRIPSKVIQSVHRKNPHIQYTHWVRFTDQAWQLAHVARRERAARSIAAPATRSIVIQTWRTYDMDGCIKALEGDEKQPVET